MAMVTPALAPGANVVTIGSAGLQFMGAILLQFVTAPVILPMPGLVQVSGPHRL
jgi:hypothetical protein